MSPPGQAVFVREMTFNLAPFIYWRIVTAAKQRQLYIDNVIENDKQVTHDCAICDKVYVEMTGIYRKLDYDEQGINIITEVFTNGTV